MPYPNSAFKLSEGLETELEKVGLRSASESVDNVSNSDT